jgi:hypothetical protein
MTIENPWREFIENCDNGSTYFSGNNYRELLSDLDRGYAALAELSALREAAGRMVCGDCEVLGFPAHLSEPAKGCISCRPLRALLNPEQSK